jgi:hypothetical protein
MEMSGMAKLMYVVGVRVLGEGMPGTTPAWLDAFLEIDAFLLPLL